MTEEGTEIKVDSKESKIDLSINLLDNNKIIDNLNEFTNSIPLKLSNDVKTSKEIININIVKKYLLISLKSKLILVNISLFIKTFFGLLNERI